MLPLSTVESQAYRRLISGISYAQVPDRKSITLHLDKVFEDMERKVKAALDAVDAVLTTADVWTGHNRSYLGMTLGITLMHCKAALAALGLLVVILMMSLQQRLSMFIAVMVLPERLLPL